MTRRAGLGAGALSVLLLASPGGAQDADLARLEAELARLAPESGGTMGIAALHLESGRAVYLNPDQSFPMASTYKVPIAVQLLTRVDRGELDLQDMIPLSAEDLHPGSGTLTRLFDEPGVALSIHTLMELMLLISDNSATDLTLEAAGGPAAVTARMRELGVEDLRVDRPTSRLIADWVGVVGVPEHGDVAPDEWERLAEGVADTTRERAAADFALDPRDTATPRAMALLLERVWAGEALAPTSTALLQDALTRVETGAERIKGILPDGTEVAHKTGTIGRTTNDVGVITLPADAGRVVTVVFVKDSELAVPERERAIAQVARAIHDFFLFHPDVAEAVSENDVPTTTSNGG